MNILDIVEIVKKTLEYFFSTILDVLRLINPASVDTVSKNIKTLPLWFLRLYLIVIAVPLFVGYYLHFAYFQQDPYSVVNSLKLSARNYVIAVFLPMAIAYLLYLFDMRLVKKKVTYADALTMIAYACSPGILSGIFRISVSQFIDTWVLHILLLMYSIYLIYAVLAARFGYDTAIKPFLFLILFGLLIAIIIYQALGFFIPPGYTGF